MFRNMKKYSFLLFQLLVVLLSTAFRDQLMILLGNQLPVYVIVIIFSLLHFTDLTFTPVKSAIYQVLNPAITLSVLFFLFRPSPEGLGVFIFLLGILGGLGGVNFQISLVNYFQKSVLKQHLMRYHFNGLI